MATESPFQASDIKTLSWSHFCNPHIMAIVFIIVNLAWPFLHLTSYSKMSTYMKMVSTGP